MTEPQQPDGQPIRRVQRTPYKKMCPYCNENIPVDARKCRYCGELLDVSPGRPPAPPLRRTSTCLILVIVGVCVVAFIGMIAAIAIPNLLASKAAANEEMAITACREVSSAQELHKARYGTPTDLEGLVEAGLFDETPYYERKQVNATRTVLTSKCGYHFHLNLLIDDGESWSMSAVPYQPGITGDRSFYIDQTGVVRYRVCTSRDHPPADSSSTPLGE